MQKLFGNTPGTGGESFSYSTFITRRTASLLGGELLEIQHKYQGGAEREECMERSLELVRMKVFKWSRG